MIELNDHELLGEFARNGSEAAFGELVRRHVNLVYSAALRFTGNPQEAEEISQAVFIILARKAGSLRRGTILGGWLYQTARLTAANFVRVEIRRQRREQEAYMQSTMNESDSATWEQIAPLLDEAMGGLGETDRAAIVLRYFENKTAGEIGAALSTTEAAAHKRVNRALDKLRRIFSKRGITLSATLIAGAVSANSVHAAPAELSGAIATAAAHGTIAASLSAVVNATLKSLAWAKFKLAATLGVAAVLAGSAVTIAIANSSPSPSATLDPVALLKGVAAARLKIKSGEMEYIVANSDYQHFPRTNYGLLKVAFDESQQRFEQLQRESSIVSMDPGADKIVAAKRIELGGDDDELARLGFIRFFDAHSRLINDGKTVTKFEFNQTEIDEARKGSGRYAFDPRTSGLTDFLYPLDTVEGCLGFGYTNAKPVTLLGLDDVNGVSAWHVRLEIQTNWNFDFWMDAAHPTHVIKQQALNRRGMVYSTYDEKHPDDPLPIETHEISYYGTDPRPWDVWMTRTNTRYNVPINPKSFTLAGLEMPIGTPVVDVRLMKRIGYWTGNGLAEDFPRPAGNGLERYAEKYRDVLASNGVVLPSGGNAPGPTTQPLATLDNTVDSLLHAKTDPSFVNVRKVVVRRVEWVIAIAIVLGAICLGGFKIWRNQRT